MKKYLLSIVTLLISVIFIIAYGAIGTEILPDGTLKEPFFLIPFAYIFVVIAIVSAVIIFVKNKLKRR